MCHILNDTVKTITAEYSIFCDESIGVELIVWWTVHVMNQPCLIDLWWTDRPPTGRHILQMWKWNDTVWQTVPYTSSGSRKGSVIVTRLL